VESYRRNQIVQETKREKETKRAKPGT
jgi:hypothetical protein